MCFRRPFFVSILPHVLQGTSTLTFFFRVFSCACVPSLDSVLEDGAMLEDESVFVDDSVLEDESSYEDGALRTLPSELLMLV